MAIRSIKTVKADAAHRVFGALGEGIVWAVISTGIDQGHIHFRKHRNLELEPPLRHRDFTASGLDDAASEMEALVDPYGLGSHIAGIIAGEVSASEDKVRLRAERHCLAATGEVSTEALDLPAVCGMAPRCKLVSLRVLDDFGIGPASNVIAALHWVQELNEGGRNIRIHGVSINAGYEYDSKWFSCGRSPICVEVDRLVRSGVVVTAPAGNTGSGRVDSDSRHTQAGLPMTINDPGNAELAITVGSTHRDDPLAFGVSYFSSKGPTLDGRMKPDLVAPGERIISCAAGKIRKSDALYREETGTNLADAHVAGVAAALLSVRPELIGKPELVKQVLTGTATDLQRDRNLQGHGLVNLMRALEEGATVLSSPQRTNVPATRAAELSPQRLAILPPEASSAAKPTPATVSEKRFAFAMSFPGEHRDYVRKVVSALRRRKVPRERIFYDAYFEAELARIKMNNHLQDIYQAQSELIVVFLSAEYESKEWCGLEWRAIQEVIMKLRSEDVMPMRFDNTRIPGLFSGDGYVDLQDRDPEDIADLIMERLEINQAARPKVPGG